jgi:hypothetical protein
MIKKATNQNQNNNIVGHLYAHLAKCELYETTRRAYNYFTTDFDLIAIL